MRRTEVSIPCGPLTLEGVLEIPTEEAGASEAAVICHPHPLYGGNMSNNVVKALRKGFLEKGVPCLRFNFRGTGKSWGSHGGGEDEVDDVLAAMDFMSRPEGTGATTLIIAGYSFGAWVGLKAATRDPRPRILVGVSPPLDVYDFSYLYDEKRPKLLMSGDRDFVCAEGRFRDLISRIPDPKRGTIIPGADHFHNGNEDILTQELESFLDEHPR